MIEFLAQKSVNFFEVYWFPWSECKIILSLILTQDNAAFRVFIAKSESILSDVMLATMLLSYKSKIEQLYSFLPDANGKNVESVHHFY